MSGADPRAIATSTRQRRLLKTVFRRKYNYEASPPRCGNCTYFLQRCKGNDVADAHPPFCNKGKFTVSALGICDAWEGRRGEQLETTDVSRQELQQQDAASQIATGALPCQEGGAQSGVAPETRQEERA